MEKLDEIQKLRMNIWNLYYSALKPLEENGFIRLPVVPDYAEHNAHLFYVLFHDEQVRDHMMKQLKESGILAIFHYVPLHSAPLGLKLGNRKEDLPMTENISGRLLRLPMYAGISEKELNYTLNMLLKVLA